MLNSILLVLDSYLAETESLIRVDGFGRKVISTTNSRAAIDYLKQGEAPELIVLDINLPVDFQCIFLHEFNKLPESVQHYSKILLVTSRNNEEKLAGLPLNKHVVGIKSLPLDYQSLAEVVALVEQSL